MEIAVIARQRVHRVAAIPLRAFVRRLVRSAPKSQATGVTIVLAGDAAVRRLNQAFRGKNKTTDVLSFPSGGEELPGGERPLGDVVISVGQAERQARAAGHTLAREVRILLIHGYLHLLGYDHEVDDGTMMRLQARLVRRLLPKARP